MTIEYLHDKLNHPKYTKLISFLKCHFHIWGVANDRIKRYYTDLNCEICLSNLSLPKRGHHIHTTGKHCLESCIVSEKISIIPDGNCLFRALSWWITGDENMHGQIRSE